MRKRTPVKLVIRDIREVSLKGCTIDNDLFARTNEGDGYMQCQVHLRDSSLCNRKFSLYSEGDADFKEAQEDFRRLKERK